MANQRIVNTQAQAIPQVGTTHRQRTISSAAVNVLNHTLSSDTSHALLQFNGANCRITFDGTTSPTSSLGFIYTDGTAVYWTKQMLQAAKAIRTASTDVTVEIQELNYA